MKQVLKAATPPVVWSALKVLKRPQSFPSWEAARAAAGTYDDAALNLFRKSRSAQGGLPDVTATPLPMLLDSLKGRATVTDYGGAFGDLGRAVCVMFPDAAYNVVETKGVVSIAETSNSVTFHRDIPKPCDVFFTSETLQFLTSPYDVLRRGLESATRYAALWRNNFAETETFLVRRSRLFENGSGPIPAGFDNAVLSCPCRTIQEARVFDIAKACGFRLLSRCEDVSGTLTESSYGANLVFARSKVGMTSAPVK
jgi:putative methyltransferase (TIGR04325 family)